MRYRVHPKVMRDVLAAACREAPREACGLLCGLSDAGLIEFYSCVLTVNEAVDQTRTFEINGTVFRQAVEMTERYRLQLGIWHSHPTSRPTPSREDFALIRQLATIPCMIVGIEPPVLTIYEVEEGTVREAYRQRVEEPQPC